MSSTIVALRANPAFAPLRRSLDVYYGDAKRDAAMDALLLLHPAVTAVGYQGAGDYFCDAAGRLRRRRPGEVAPFIFTGVQILHPRLFTAAPAGAFSLNRLYDKAQEEGRLWGVRHDGLWFHVGTPEGLAETEELLRPPRTGPSS